ncbi:MAG: carboxypeptidase regulatory-like domain-containing protein [Planctomycetota bacterium]|nr:carboxypeptidase regulatory-like domain-containing protein [Planctomycetota bacterium]
MKTGKMTTVGLLAWLLFSGGCTDRRRADYSQLQLVEVSGQVSLDGQPLAQATIIFETEDRDFSIGQTDVSGRYRLSYNSEKSGVTPGRKTVRISTWPGAFTEAAAPTEETKGAAGSSRELVPARYNTRSELTVVVASNTPTFSFDLRSVAR